MTTVKELESLVEYLNKITKSPAAPYFKAKSGAYVARVGNYSLAGAYGGYTVYRMVNASGGVSELFPGYMPKKELAARLRSFIAGIEYSKRK